MLKHLTTKLLKPFMGSKRKNADLKRQQIIDDVTNRILIFRRQQAHRELKSWQEENLKFQ